MPARKSDAELVVVVCRGAHCAPVKFNPTVTWI